MFKHSLTMGLVLLSLSLPAQSFQGQAVAGFIDEMVEIHHLDRTYLTALFAQAERKESILAAIAKPAEKTLTWKEYQKIFLKERRITEGREFMVQYRDALLRAEQQFGVPAKIITAIIGVETYYGRNKGSYRVIDALSTLAFDYPPRSQFFTSELTAFLLLVKEQGFDATAIKGSYAGAMGYGQFISSSYRHYAVDFDGDGVADIVNNPIDAIGSVANYFNRHGWQQGQAVVAPAAIGASADKGLANQSLKPSRSVAQWQTKGFGLNSPLDKKAQATLMVLAGEQGDEAWLGLKNFYVITRYNHSPLYAMAVFQLSELF